MKTSKTILTVFNTDHADTVGSAVLLRILRHLSDKSQLIVLTNQPSFLRNHLECRIIGFESFSKIRFFRLDIFKFICGLTIIFAKFDYLFLFHGQASYSVYNIRHKPFICYIHQSHEIIIPESLQNRNDILSKIKKHYRKFKILKTINGINRAVAVYAISPQLQRYFAHRGVHGNKITYLPIGVDHTFTEINEPNDPLYMPDEKFIVIYSGWVGDNRGLNIILHGFKALSNNGFSKICCIIIGCEAKLLEPIREKIKLMGLEETIYIYGRIDMKYMSYYISKAAVGISLLQDIETYRYSPPQKVFEYFIMNKPVIANKIDSHEEYITNGINGVLIDYDASSFANAIKMIYNNSSLYAFLQENIKLNTTYWAEVSIAQILECFNNH